MDQHTAVFYRHREHLLEQPDCRYIIYDCITPSSHDPELQSHAITERSIRPYPAMPSAVQTQPRALQEPCRLWDACLSLPWRKTPRRGPERS